MNILLALLLLTSMAYASETVERPRYQPRVVYSYAVQRATMDSFDTKEKALAEKTKRIAHGESCEAFKEHGRDWYNLLCGQVITGAEQLNGGMTDD